MKKCVTYRTNTLFGSYFFEQTCLFVETLPGILILPFFPFFIITITKNILITSLHIIHFCAIILQVEFVGVLRSVPLRRNEIRSILEDDCPLSSIYKLMSQIRLKDTTLSLDPDTLSAFQVFVCTAGLLPSCFLFMFLNEHEELQS